MSSHEKIPLVYALIFFKLKRKSKRGILRYSEATQVIKRTIRMHKLAFKTDYCKLILDELKNYKLINYNKLRVICFLEADCGNQFHRDTTFW